MDSEALNKAFPEEIYAHRSFDEGPYRCKGEADAAAADPSCKDRLFSNMVAVYKRVEVYEVKKTVVLDRIPVEMPAKKVEPASADGCEKYQIQFEDLPEAIKSHLTWNPKICKLHKVEKVHTMDSDESPMYRVWIDEKGYMQWYRSPVGWRYTCTSLI